MFHPISLEIESMEAYEKLSICVILLTALAVPDSRSQAVNPCAGGFTNISPFTFYIVSFENPVMIIITVIRYLAV